MILTIMVIYLIESAFLMLSRYALPGWLRGKVFSKRPRWHVQESLEGPGEVILVGVPTGKGNFAHGLVVLMKKSPGFGDSNGVDVLIEGHPYLPFECSLKTRQAHSAITGRFFQGDAIHQMFVDVMEGSPYGIFNFIPPSSAIFEMQRLSDAVDDICSFCRFLEEVPCVCPEYGYNEVF